MAVLLAIAAAIVVGSGDYFGGVASRHGRILAVALWVHVGGVATMIVLGPLIGGDPTAADLWWGAAAGIAGAVGILALYLGFARSRMGVVAPVSAVVAAGLPVLFGVATGERPSALVVAGLGLGIVAIALVSRPGRHETAGSTAAGAVRGLVAGIAFGALFILLSRAEDGSGVWPVLPARVAGAALLLVVVLGMRTRRTPVQASWPAIGAAGAMGVGGNGLFLLASQEGLLSVVAVLTSMYPAATVAWARLASGERLTGLQLVGVAAALTAVGMIAGG